MTKTRAVSNKVVYVVAMHTESTGGFDWFYEEGAAKSHYEAEKREFARLDPNADGVKYIGAVTVPARDSEGITNWLDREGVELWDI